MIKEISDSGVVTDIIRDAKTKEMSAFARQIKGKKGGGKISVPKLEDAN